jgi:small subunit ribosomal protein S1
MVENNDEFWDNLENDEHQIIKWSEDGNYDGLSVDEIESINIYQTSENISELKVGDVVNGTISSMNKREIVIDVDYKDSVYVDINASDLKLTQNLEKGSIIDVMITSTRENPFEIKGSITELIKIDVANKLRDLYKEKQSLIATVKEIIPAGFMLNIEMNGIDLNAFMPNTLAGVNRLSPEQSQELIGQNIDVMLETLQQEKGVYVVSRKKYLKSLIPKAIKQLEREHVYTGVVTGSKDFGVFVEFSPDAETPNCLTGMIHKVNLNEAFHDKMNNNLQGFEIDFYVQDVLKGDRLVLTQILNEDTLWNTIKVNQVKQGKVIAIKPFGALISLDEQTMGLIQTTYINKSGRNLKKGDMIDVKVISVIKDDRKIYLSFPDLKQ